MHTGQPSHTGVSLCLLSAAGLVLVFQKRESCPSRSAGNQRVGARGSCRSRPRHSSRDADSSGPPDWFVSIPLPGVVFERKASMRPTRYDRLRRLSRLVSDRMAQPSGPRAREFESSSAAAPFLVLSTGGCRLINEFCKDLKSFASHPAPLGQGQWDPHCPCKEQPTPQEHLKPTVRLAPQVLGLSLPMSNCLCPFACCEFSLCEFVFHKLRCKRN